MALMDKIALLDTKIKEMKVAVGLEENVSLDELVTKVESGGTTTKSNIYKVASIEERDAITDMVEGDMCVVHTSSIANMQVTDSVTAITFPATVVLPEAFTGNAWVSLRDADMTFDVMVDLAQTRMRCDIMADDYISISYTSTDGITYTREDSYAETIEFSSPVSCAYPEEWNDVLGYFLQVGGIEFGGLFEYTEGLWNYSKIGISTTADYVYADKNVYTDTGNLIGTLATNSINTFDDTDAFVFSKIQKHYDNMDIIVAPADSSSLYNGSKLYVLPMKSDGTPLLDTSAATNMQAAFSNCTNLETIPKLNTSNVTKMRSMFANDYNLKTLPLLDTSKVTDMRTMFAGCSKLIEIPAFDTSSVTDMYQMFRYCAGLTEFPAINTSNVTTMYQMFQGCKSLTTIPLLDTSNVTDMYMLFADCSKLTTIPLLDLNNVTTTAYFFKMCTNLKTVPLLNTSNVTNMTSMFSYCESLTEIPQLDTSNVTSMNSMFAYCKSLTTIPLLDTSNVTGMSEMFNACVSLTELPQLNTSKVTSMGLMFGSCRNLTTLPVLDLSSITSTNNMTSTFAGCDSLSDESLDNIMKSCISAVNITSTLYKSAAYIGLNEEQRTKLPSLPSYNAFIAAGWTIE